jgi:hypothetical protein
MPTLANIDGFRFFIYSNENEEPIHIHVTKGNGNGKIWLEPKLSVAYLRGFTPAEERRVMEIVTAKAETFKKKWNEHFSK